MLINDDGAALVPIQPKHRIRKAKIEVMRAVGFGKDKWTRIFAGESTVSSLHHSAKTYSSRPGVFRFWRNSGLAELLEVSEEVLFIIST